MSEVTTTKLKLNLKEVINDKIHTFSDEKASEEKEKRQEDVTSPVFVNNDTSETKTVQKNKIDKISCDKETIIPNELVTYTVKLDEAEKDKVKTEIKQVKFCLWFQNEKCQKLVIDKEITPAEVVVVRNRDSAPVATHIFEPRTEKGETLTGNLDRAYYYAKISYTDNEAKLEIKYSKWMDSYRVRVEAYLGNKILQDGGATTASRWVKATPEVLDAFWVNAKGEKITHTGYHEELSLYIKTLGLQGKEIEVKIYDKDYVPSPLHSNKYPLYGNQKGDDLIAWENNQIKINKPVVLKQFKVGDKQRYEEAQKDETQEDKAYAQWYDNIIAQDCFFTCMNFKMKYSAPLLLYIHFPQQENLKMPANNAFASLVLTDKECIANAFFSQTEKETAQADAPQKETKNKRGEVTNSEPTYTEMTQYEKINKGTLGQTVQLVAECPNLEEKTVTFEVYEKTPLLEDTNKPLPLIHKDAEKTRIQAKVENGFAVAEVKLRPKSDEDFKEWREALSPKEIVAITDPIKGQSYPKDSIHDKHLWGINSYEPVYGEPLPPLTTKLFLKVSCLGDVKLHKKVFLQDEGLEVGKGSLLFPFKSIPLNHPKGFKNKNYERYDYTENEDNATTFAYGRKNKKTGKVVRLHAARDLYTEVGEPIYAIYDGIVKKVYSFYNDTWAIEIEHDYEHKNGYKLYVCYGEVHQDDILVKAGDKVVRGQQIAKVGLLRPYVRQPYPDKRGMLHLEMYTGEASGNLSDKSVKYSDMLYATSIKNKGVSFQRRKDLFDPLELIEEMLSNSNIQ